jgi:hypothetical protein
MSYPALLNYFSNIEELPIPVDDVLHWIRNNTEHHNIKLYPVQRNHKAFRGAIHRSTMPSLVPYNTEPEILNKIFFGADLDSDWQRLVIVKELTHLFDPANARVTTEEDIKKLIPAVIVPQLQGTEFSPAIMDRLGAFRALAILVPEAARIKLQKAFEIESRTIDEIARYCSLPTSYVDIWMRHGEQLSKIINL